MATLPTPRALITSLISSLPPSLPANDDSNDAPPNALRALSGPSRAVLTTLHVLFPSLLLPALDLLDRGLVTRIIQVTPSQSQPVPTVKSPQAHIHLRQADEVPLSDQDEVLRQTRKQNTVYLVRSAQESRSRGGGRYGGTSGGTTYIVRLEAWNCTCAAFTFSAFPATSSSYIPWSEEAAGLDLGLRHDGRARTFVPEHDERWQFGGKSLDGIDGTQAVPCCKHLLACVLIERWEGGLRQYLVEKRVGTDEMAGIGGEL